MNSRFWLSRIEGLLPDLAWVLDRLRSGPAGGDLQPVAAGTMAWGRRFTRGDLS